MTFISLFAGIGGLDLGLERSGMRCVGQVEIEPYCRAVLAKHWPDVPRWADVRAFNGSECGSVDLVCGGFPCQNVSVAGNGEGLAGERSGLWYEMLRVIRAARPAWVLAENVPALRTRGYDAVAAGLEAAGYTVRPLVVGAWAVGAPHERNRVWIIADTVSQRNERSVQTGSAGKAGPGWARCTSPMPYWDRPWDQVAFCDGRCSALVSRVDYGLPDWVDRVGACGNAVSPQVAEVIGRAIIEHNELLRCVTTASPVQERNAGSCESAPDRG